MVIQWPLSGHYVVILWSSVQSHTRYMTVDIGRYLSAV